MSATRSKVSNLLVSGLFIFLNFLICKLHFGRKRPQGLRHPSVLRLQRRMDNAIFHGRAFRKPALLMRIVLTLVFLVLIFFNVENRTVVTTPTRAFAYISVIILGLLSIFGSMSAYRVAAGVTRRGFLASPEDRRFGILAVLWVCLLFGMARSFAMMHGPTVYYTFGEEVCRLAPMMPIYGGDLYFDRESYNFVVVADGKISFYVPHLSSQEAPACI